MDALGYIRVSTEDQARDDRTSLAQQREAIAALAVRLQRTLGQMFEDAGASGGSAERRPGFMALVAYCRAHPRPAKARGVVLVLNDSRWGRFPDPEEGAWWRFELKRAGWVVRFAEGDDTEDPQFRPMLRAFHSGQASAYRALIRQNARRGAIGTASQGYWQNEAPIGYRRAVVTPGGEIVRVLEPGQRKATTEKVRLVPGPAAEVELVRWLFARYATGAVSCYSLAAEAWARWPAKRWSNVVVRHILVNPAYAGDVVWMRRPWDEDRRRQTVARDSTEWVVVRNAHPALVDRTCFDAVAGLLRANQHRVRITAGGYPLSGLLTCAHCGDTYVGGGGPKGPPEDPDRYRFYRHAVVGRVRPGQTYPSCPDLFATLPRRFLEPAVAQAIGQALQQPAGQRAIRRAVDAALDFLVGGHRHAAARERERAKAQAEIDRLVQLAAAGVFVPEEIAARVAQSRARLRLLDEEAQRAAFAARRVATFQAERDRLVAQALNFTAEWQRCSAAERRSFLLPWIHSAIVDRGARELVLRLNPLPGLIDSGDQPAPGSR